MLEIRLKKINRIKKSVRNDTCTSDLVDLRYDSS